MNPCFIAIYIVVYTIFMLYYFFKLDMADLIATSLKVRARYLRAPPTLIWPENLGAALERDLASMADRDEVVQYLLNKVSPGLRGSVALLIHR